MAEFKFRPQLGYKTEDCYLHGAGDRDSICDHGVIEYVGSDYFIVRNLEKNIPIMITSDSYWVMNEDTFYD